MRPEQLDFLRRRWWEFRRAAGLPDEVDPQAAAEISRIILGATLRSTLVDDETPAAESAEPGSRTSLSPSPTPGTTPAEPSKESS